MSGQVLLLTGIMGVIAPILYIVVNGMFQDEIGFYEFICCAVICLVGIILIIVSLFH